VVSRSAALLLAGLALGAPASLPAAPAPPWLGPELPLPLPVRTPQDIAFKTEAERQYLIFNLMATGKVAYDGGDLPRAIRSWQTLLAIPGLSPDIERVVRPLLAEAERGRAAAPADPGRRAEAPPADTRIQGAPPLAPPPTREPGVTVSGTATGGGAIGPGAAVLWLRRLDGPTPAPHASRRPIAVGQLNKAFVPHVLAIPVGSKVVFRNDDPYYHNVFSLDGAQKFDTGLYASGRSYTQAFGKAGLVELLCNIHTAMRGYLYVVDSRYYTQPRAGGRFVIKDVPPGRYELNAWHELSAEILKQPLSVGAAGVQGLTLRIPDNRPPSAVVPDKYGKPRQPQLGY
jgi:plastocyanin